MESSTPAVIIGGGPSGLAAANQLHASGVDFTLITDRLGGRMYHSDDFTMNFGATYLNDDYKHILKFARRGRRLRLRDVWSTDGTKLIRFFSPSNLPHLPGLLKVIWLLRRLRTELNSFRADCVTTPQVQALANHHLIAKLASLRVRDFVAEYGIEYLHKNFFRYVFTATCFAEPDDSNALFYLGTLFPLIIPTYMVDYAGAIPALTSGFRDRILLDTAISVERRDKQYVVSTSQGRALQCSYLVLAAPYHNASKLWDVPAPHRTTSASVLYVAGERNAEFRGKPFVMLDPSRGDVGLIWTQNTGADLIFSLSREPNLGVIYAGHTVLGQADWKTAVVLSDAHWVPLEISDNLFLAGDYNVCGLEDSFITGICAANHIAARVRGMTGSRS